MDKNDTLPALNETAVAAYDLDAIMPSCNSLERRFKLFSGQARHSIQPVGRSRQSPDKRGVQEILVHDRPNLKKEDFLSELEVEAIANVKTNNPQRRYGPLVEKQNSIFSTPTQANNMSFLDGKTNASITTQFDTQIEPGSVLEETKD